MWKALDPSTGQGGPRGIYGKGQPAASLVVSSHSPQLSDSVEAFPISGWDESMKRSPSAALQHPPPHLGREPWPLMSMAREMPEGDPRTGWGVQEPHGTEGSVLAPGGGRCVSGKDTL